MPQCAPYIAVIGAGPAGLAAAAAAAAEGGSVRIFERGDRPGRKILLAGGGKANVANRCVTPAHYVGSDPGFTAAVLARMTPELCVRRLEQAGVALEEREHGQLFCRAGAGKLLDALLRACRERACVLQCDSPVRSIAYEPGRGFSLDVGAETFHARRVILAAGSPAWPQSGADDAGVRLARTLGHHSIPFRPALVPLVMPPDWPLHGLAGISAVVKISSSAPASPTFMLPALVTHKGLSGPATLQISCYHRNTDSLSVDWLPQTDVIALLREQGAGGKSPRALVAPFLADRLARVLIPKDMAERKSAELSRRDRVRLADALHRHTATPLRSEGMRRAEAAAGGVDVRSVDPETMQSRLVPGLFFCGEVLDVVGQLGGYNLHWALASGQVAGEAAGAAPG